MEGSQVEINFDQEAFKVELYRLMHKYINIKFINASDSSKAIVK